MSLFRTIRNWTAAALISVASAINSVEGRYEAGQRYSPRRTWLPGWIRDARFDADQATRIEIVRKSRYFERNSAILNRLLDLFEQYTVGPEGLQFVPASSDEEWNRKAKKFWDDWCKLCDLTSLQPFGTIQSLASRIWAVDGEAFVIKTRGKNRPNGPSWPRIQLVETHRVETPPGTTSDRIIDGIEVDERGRPIAYHIKDSVGGSMGLAEETFKKVNADEMVHIFEPSRPGQYRGLPIGYAVIGDLHDLDDLQMWSMDGSKASAKKTAVIKTASGELSNDDLRRARFNMGPASGTGQGTSGGSAEERTKYYQDHGMAEAVVLQTGDEYAEHTVNRPSESERALWDYLTSKVCAGFGVSKLLVFPHSLQGTVTRADLDVAAAFFKSRSAVLASKFTEIYTWVIEWGTRNVIELADPPADWREVSVRSPRSVNVDVGRNSNALISEYEAGWRTLEEICGELGFDWRRVLRQRARELAEAMKLEKEFNLPEGSLIRKVLDTLKANKEAQAPTQQQPADQPA